VKGRNRICLNQSTLIAAVQMYLDSERKETAPPIVVTSVSVDNNNGGCLHVVADVSSEVPE
jgi:hypothetical protein